MVSDYSFLSWELLSGWLITYWLHSTIWLGGLALVLRFTRMESFAVRELCWRVAMPLGFATAMVAISLDSGFRMNMADVQLIPNRIAPLKISSSTEIKSPISTPDNTEAELSVDPSAYPSLPDESRLATFGGTRIAPAKPEADLRAVSMPLTIHENTNATHDSVFDAPINGSNAQAVQIGCMAWLFICACFLLRRTIASCQLHRWLKGSQKHALLDELVQNLAERVPNRRQTRVVMLDAAQPFTVGWLRPTIVIPQRAMHELSHDQLRALLSHELGHVQCGHAFWLHVLNVVCQLGFFQPLNLWAYRCWRREAELMADSWATRHCVRPKKLASCLLQVATWQIMPRGAGMLQFMGRRRDALVERVECLVGQTRKTTKPQLGLTTRASWAIACAAVLLALLGPKFSSASPHLAQNAGLSPLTQATWLSVQQEWEALRIDISALSRVAKENDAHESRAQISVLLKQLEKIDRRYQAVQLTIDQEVGQ